MEKNIHKNPTDLSQKYRMNTRQLFQHKLVIYSLVFKFQILNSIKIWKYCYKIVNHKTRTILRKEYQATNLWPESDRKKLITYALACEILFSSLLFSLIHFLWKYWEKDIKNYKCPCKLKVVCCRFSPLFCSTVPLSFALYPITNSIF